MAVKIIELIGTSPNNFEGAVQEAIDKSEKTLKNIQGVDVLGFKAKVNDGKVSEYRAHLNVAFEVE
jgi:flavin-binding protein dodecin